MPLILWFDGMAFDRELGLSVPVKLATRRRIDRMGPLEFLLETSGYGAFTAELRGATTVIRGASEHFVCDLEENTCELVEQD